MGKKEDFRLASPALMSIGIGIFFFIFDVKIMAYFNGVSALLYIALMLFIRNKQSNQSKIVSIYN